MQHVKTARAIASRSIKQKRQKIPRSCYTYATIAPIEALQAPPSQSTSEWPHTFGQPLPSTHPHLLQVGEITPGIQSSEYEARRRKLMSPLPAGAVVISCGARVQYMSQSIFYKFRQATDFFYLTGFDEPDAAVVLQKDSSSRGYSMRLFCRPKSPDREVWDGPRTGTEGAQAVFGADEALDVADLARYLRSVLNSHTQTGPIYVDLPDQVSSTRVSQSRLSKSIIEFFTAKTGASNLDLFGLGKRKDDREAVIASLSGKHATKTRSLKNEVEKLRLYKSDAEVACMRKAAEISSHAHAEVMTFARPGLDESQLVSHFEYNTSQRGSTRLGYVPVCASGTSGLTLHYTSNNRLLKAGETVLLDAGCEYAGYASDLTRTFPISGHFSSPQKDLYAAVLSTNKACIKLCSQSQGYTMNALHNESVRLLRTELKQIGFHLGYGEIEKLYPHYLCHPLGLDLHDTMSFQRNQRLEAGMVLTIEPGVYVPFDSRFPKAFQGLAVRIEDEVAVGKEDYTVLSANAPKEVVDVEATCKNLFG